MSASPARPSPVPRPAPAAPLEAAPPPLFAKVDALLKQGKPAEAISLAYRSTEDDVRRAFGLKLPKQWTHRELLEKYLRPDMGLLVTLLPQLYAKYEPVRYGSGPPPSGDGVMELLRKIYAEPSMRRLSWTIGADSTLTSRPAAARAPAARPAGGPG